MLGARDIDARFDNLAAVASPDRLIERSNGLGLDEQGHDLGVREAYLPLDLDCGGLALGHAQRVGELEAERSEDLVRCELRGKHAIGFT